MNDDLLLKLARIWDNLAFQYTLEFTEDILNDGSKGMEFMSRHGFVPKIESAMIIAARVPDTDWIMYYQDGGYILSLQLEGFTESCFINKDLITNKNVLSHFLLECLHWQNPK